MLALAFMIPIWMDKLWLKQVGLDDWRYEIIKIFLQSCIAYKLSKYLIRIFQLENLFKSLKSNTLFLCTFLLLNSYIITQYTSRIISHQITNKEIRNEINKRTIRLGPAGWGYECDSLSYKEYKELTKDTNLPKIPKESTLAFVHDWYEIDFHRIVEFQVPKSIDIETFYKDDVYVLKYLNTVDNGSYVSRRQYFSESPFYKKQLMQGGIQVKYDTIKYTKFIYEVTDN